MKTLFHPANLRGHADHGWLNSHHSFSFANYYDPEKMHFGALRVLNDDRIAPETGFGKHPHENMEIISIPLEGSLRHEDSMGNQGTIEQGEVQVMSAGKGIVHSEMNASSEDNCAFLQIWVIPNKQNVEPRYGQAEIKVVESINSWNEIVGPKEDNRNLWIHQNAWLHQSHFQKGEQRSYSIKRKGNGVYFFILNGDVSIENKQLTKRDAIGIWECESINLTFQNDCDILAIEVPMEW
jgi:redox-sensitive bicupin YhaK (pirin superfamily)